MSNQIPSYLLNHIVQDKHAAATRQYKECTELMQAMHAYLLAKYEEASKEEEQSESVEVLFKNLGRRLALREFIKILPEPKR